MASLLKGPTHRSAAPLPSPSVRALRVPLPLTRPPLIDDTPERRTHRPPPECTRPLAPSSTSPPAAQTSGTIPAARAPIASPLILHDLTPLKAHAEWRRDFVMTLTTSTDPHARRVNRQRGADAFIQRARPLSVFSQARRERDRTRP